MSIQTPTKEITSPWTPSVVRERAAKGAVALIARQVLTQGLNMLGAILLARLLSPGQFGIYAIITFVLGFLITFGDVGLGASLIRQSAEPTTDEYRAIFTVQQALVVVVVAVVWAVAPSIARAYHLADGDAWLFRFVALSLLATSFQVVPSLRLERHLAFDRLAVIEVAQAVIYNALAVGLAWRGVGAMSFALALLARACVGMILANVVSPWRIGWRWDWPWVRAHLRFGLPYQASSFVSLAKDSITPVLVGLLLGATQVGYLNWAGMVAAYPVIGLMVLQRIYLPAFARMQEHPAELSGFVEQVLRVTNAIVAPLAILTLVLIQPLTALIFGEKWLVALPYFVLLWAANLFVASTTPLMGMINALGHPRVVFLFTAVWMLGTWLIGAPLIMRFGAIGFAIANLAVQFTNLALYRAAQRYIPFRLLPIVAPPWIWAAVLGVCAYFAQWVVPIGNVVVLAAYFCIGLIVYVVGAFTRYPTATRLAWAWIRRQRWLPVSRS